MESIWSDIATQFSFGIPWLSLLIFFIIAVWRWFTSNNVERLFLSKSIALINRFFELIGLLLFMTALTIFSIFLNPKSLDSLLIYTTLPTICYTLYFLIYFFFVLESQPFFQKIKNMDFFNKDFFMKIKGFFKNKFIVNVSLIVFITLAVYLFRHAINLSAILYIPWVEGHLTASDTDTTAKIFTFIINEGFREYSYRIFLPFLIWFLFFCYVLGTPLVFIRRRLPNSEYDKQMIKATVVLKDGSKFVDIYLKNNSSGNFFHFHNKSRSPTQYLVLHKDEVEHFLFDEHNHNSEDSIRKQQNSE